MTQQKKIVAQFSYKVDQASIAQAVQANKAVAASFLTTQDAAKTFSADVLALNPQLAQQATTQQAITTQLQTQTALADRLAQAAKVRSNAEADFLASLRAEAFGGAATGSGGRSVTGTIGGLQQAAIALPGVGYQSPLVVGIRAVGLIADKTGASFGQLGVGLGIAGAAAVAVAIALDRFNQELNGSKKALDGALAAQKNYYAALGELTAIEVDAQIEALRRARPLIEAQVAETRNALESAFAQAQQTPLGDIGARALFNQLPTGALKEVFDEAEKALQENIQTETRLTQGRETGTFYANDLRAAEEQLADARQEAVEQATGLIKSQFVENAETYARALTLTSDERRKEVDALSLQITALEYRQGLLDEERKSLEVGTTAFIANQLASNELEASVTSLRLEQIELIGVTLSYADILKQLENQQTALSSQTDAYFTSLTNEVSAREALTKLTNEQTAAEAENAAKRQAMVEEGEAKRTEIVASAAEQRQKIDADDAERRAKIQRDYNRSYGEAVANRDALGALKAKQARDDQLTDQQKAYSKAQTELDRSTQKQLDAQRKALDTQLRQFDAAAQKEQQARAQAQRRAQADLANALASERAITQNSQQLRLIQEFNHQNALIALAYNAGEATKAIAQNTVDFIKSISSAAGNMLGSGKTYDEYTDLGTGTPFRNAGTGFGGGRGAALPTYAAGSRYISHDQLAIVHRGERVLSAQENRAGGMSISVALTYDPANIDRIWPPLRRKIIDAMRTPA